MASYTVGLRLDRVWILLNCVGLACQKLFGPYLCTINIEDQIRHLFLILQVNSWNFKEEISLVSKSSSASITACQLENLQ